MPFRLISATPSPYARKVRIALNEKELPFQLETEVPWDASTQTPKYNPLEKLPVLIVDEETVLYESHYILEWLEAKHPDHALLPSDIDDRLLAKRVEVIADGICDACVLAFFEKQREHPSQPWTDRQMRKIDGGLKALAELKQKTQGEYILPYGFSLADIAAGSVLGYLAVRWPQHQWREQYPGLKQYWEKLEQRSSFASTKPSPQNIKDKIV